MNIGEMARISGVTIRTLRYYDRIGLLTPSSVTESGYRCYDDAALRRLYIIRLFRELEVPVKDIKRMLDTPGFTLDAALDMQLPLLAMRRAHLDRLIEQAHALREKGMDHMDFTAFTDRQQADWTAQAKAAYGSTPAWQEFEQKENARHPEDSKRYGRELMDLLAAFGQCRPAPESAEAQTFVQQLRDFITGHFYTCTLPILRSLADMYETGDFSRSIDQAGGPGTAASIAAAMRIYCDRRTHGAD